MQKGPNTEDPVSSNQHRSAEGRRRKGPIKERTSNLEPRTLNLEPRSAGRGQEAERADKTAQSRLNAGRVAGATGQAEAGRPRATLAFARCPLDLTLGLHETLGQSQEGGLQADSDFADRAGRGLGAGRLYRGGGRHYHGGGRGDYPGANRGSGSCSRCSRSTSSATRSRGCRRAPTSWWRRRMARWM